MKCRYCSQNVELPFRCPFCGEYYCGDHRLPENHACPEIWKARPRQTLTTEERRSPVVGGETEEFEKETSIVYPFRFRVPTLTSSTEILHLVAGALIVMTVGLSMYGSGLEWVFLLFEEPLIMLSSALVFTVIFVSHELAHKAAAKYFGLWAEFRLNLMGAVLTLITVASPLMKIVSPGAVIIAGAVSRRIVGITSLAGPLTSMVFTCLFFALHFLVPDSSLASMLLRGAMLGAWIAFLNLIPFGILDGDKVLRWSKPVWVASFSASMICFFVVLRFLLA